VCRCLEERHELYLGFPGILPSKPEQGVACHTRRLDGFTAAFASPHSSAAAEALSSASGRNSRTCSRPRSWKHSLWLPGGRGSRSTSHHQKMSASVTAAPAVPNAPRIHRPGQSTAKCR
jgi:hypothetical protein